MTEKAVSDRVIPMAPVFIGISLLLVAVTICFSLAFTFTNASAFLTLAITSGTAAYHFCMRLITGIIVNAVMGNKADYRRAWFRVGEREFAFYNFINVKKWKDKMPTYDKKSFDIRRYSLEKLAQVTCQAEIVHEIIIAASFLPIIAVAWFGALPVFIITSCVAAGIDLMYVFIQRFNRYRLLRVIKKKCP